MKSARRDILDLFADNEFSCQQDNARPHIHKKSMAYIRRWISNDIKDHPPQSPDLNPIELVWKRLKDMVEARRLRDKQQLRETIQSCWEEIPMNFIRICIQGLTNKMAQAIQDADEKLEVETEDESMNTLNDSIDDGFESEDSLASDSEESTEDENSEDFNGL